jgi:hypothetical protein
MLRLFSRTSFALYFVGILLLSAASISAEELPQLQGVTPDIAVPCPRGIVSLNSGDVIACDFTNVACGDFFGSGDNPPPEGQMFSGSCCVGTGNIGEACGNIALGGKTPTLTWNGNLNHPPYSECSFTSGSTTTGWGPFPQNQCNWDSICSGCRFMGPSGGLVLNELKSGGKLASSRRRPK